MGKPSQPFSILIGGWVLRLAHKLAGTCCNAGKALLVRCLHPTLVGSLLLTEGAGHL